MAGVFVLLVYLISLSYGYKIIGEDDDISETLLLPSEYYLKAEKIDILADMLEPIEIWYSAEYNRSRIDVDHGTVRRYYYWDYSDSEEGQVYTISPKTTDTVENEMACYTKEISQEEQNHDAFPSEGFYVYAGNKEHEGRSVDVWNEMEESDDVRTENVMYTYKAGRGVDVPVQIVKKKFNTEKGTTDTHVIYNYFNYEPLICLEDLDAEKDNVCVVTPDDFHGTMKSLHPALDGDLDIAFDSFKKHHKKDYSNNEEHWTRKEIFHKNWKLIVDHNRKNLGYKLAINHLADRTAAELRRMNGARKSENPGAPLQFPHSDEEVREIVSKLPKEYDMRLEGYITPIRNQGNCASCWAFATTAAVEGALARDSGRSVVLSEQSLVDCSWSDAEGGNEGCEGGYPQKALRHVMKHGLPLDEDYGGYLSQNSYCNLKNATEIFKIKGFTMATPLSESAVKVALYKYGPVVVTIQANTAFQFYSNGVFYDHECQKDRVNHAVTIVGYGARDGVNYWIVKNSYGERWGEEGYMLLSATNNNCFALNEPYYPVA